MLEGPAFQAAIGRLPDPPINLAAWGLTMSLSLLIESPAIMLLATAIALVRDADSYLALRRFMVSMSVVCTLLTGLAAFTPLFHWVARDLMGQPADIVAGAKPAMQIMLFWTAAIAWRRFYQGILVRYGQTRLVSWGTAVRLAAAVVTAAYLTQAKIFPGAQAAAWAMMAAVVSEAVAATVFARPLVRQEFLKAAVPETQDSAPPLTQRAILRFHAPLAATTLLTLLAQPLTSAALARLPAPTATLAAWPVVFMALLVLRGWGLSLQEITVAQMRDDDLPARVATLRRFAWIVGGVTSGLAVLVTATPLLNLYLARVLSLPPDLWPAVRAGMLAGALLPLLTTLGSWARGMLVGLGKTDPVYRGMGVGLVTHIVLLALAVALRLPGMAAASGAFTLAMIAELVFLLRACRACDV